MLPWWAILIIVVVGVVLLFWAVIAGIALHTFLAVRREIKNDFGRPRPRRR